MGYMYIGTSKIAIPTVVKEKEEFKYKVIVLDYDGTEIKTIPSNENTVITLPTYDRTHEGLVFEEWAATTTITNGTVKVTDSDILVAPYMKTLSKKNEFIIELNASSGLTVSLNISDEVDWGDGVVDNSGTHTYETYGIYTIKTSTITPVISNRGLFGNYNNTTINGFLIEAHIDSNITVPNYLFYYCYGLKYCSMSKQVKGLGSYSFGYCGIRFLVTPKTLGSYSMYNAYNLNTLLLPQGFTTGLGSSCLDYSNVRYIIFPDSITTLDGLMYLSMLKSVNRFKNVNLVQAAFASCSKLESPLIFKTTFRNNTNPSLSYLYNVPEVRIKNMSSVQFPFSGMYNLKKFTIEDERYSAMSFTLSDAYLMEYLKLPLGTYYIRGMSGFRSLKELDCTNLYSSTTLETNISTSLNPNCVIKIKFNQYETYCEATNWNLLKDKFVIVDGVPHFTFNIEPANAILKVNDVITEERSFDWYKTHMEYIIYNPENNVYSIEKIPTVLATDNITITKDLTNDYNIVGLNIGISGLYIEFTINGSVIVPEETENGIYTIKLNQSEDTTVDYKVYGETEYMDYISSFVANVNSDTIEQISLTPAIIETFVRPNLTSNGTMGGNEFAVGGGGNRAPYFAVDNSTSTYWAGNTYTTSSITIYNPYQLNISKIVANFYSSSHSANSTARIYGAHRDYYEDWVEIPSTYSKSGLVGTFNSNTNLYYKYIKISFDCSAYNTPYVTDLVFTATTKRPSE